MHWRHWATPEQERHWMSDDRKLAMFMDFENIVRGVKEAQYKQFEIKLVLERLVEKGKIMVKRAYADWNRYAEYKRPFHEHAIELIDVPQSRYSGKNSADIRMVVDAMDLAYAKQHVDSFALVSGDSDFSPLVSKLRENDRYVIGLGVKSSSSELLVGNCDEFIFYEDLIRESKKTTALRGLPEKKAEAFAQLIEAIQALQKAPVRHRLVGPFKGWTGDTVFTLDNGEMWKQRLPGRYAASLENPEVEIYRNLFGFYELRIVKTGQKVGVTRLK